MASKTTSRSLQSISRRAQRGCSCSSTSFGSIRQFSAPASKPDTSYETGRQQRPRWSYTPEKMMAPFPARPKNPEMGWECNSDPARLDQFYVKFLGRGGDSILSEDIKWLAITHKSFDQGRRGFNDRLAFFGRRILNLQLSLSLLNSPVATTTQAPPNPNDQRIPFTHPSLEGLQNLSDVAIGDILTKNRIGGLATQLGMREVLRWKPRMPANLEGSGIDVVLTSTVYAIIGAIAMHRGADVANLVARERVLKPLGIS